MAHLVAYCLPKNIKLVITWHSDIVKQKKLLQFYQPFLKNIIKRADAIIAATPAHFSSSEQLIKWGNPDRFFVVPYGINADSFTSLAPGAIAINSIKEKYQPEKIIFAVGRHVYYKGYEYLIRAMKDIANTILLLGGTGPLTDQLKNLANSLHLEKRIVFLGCIPEDQLASYYHAADVFCLPSVEKSEAFGLVQLEAMACKKPVICCELHNGVTYVNQNGITGLVVPPRDPFALAQAINTLLQDEQLRLKMGANGYNRVITEFTQEKMWQETLNVYNKILAR
jgi:rhamnosyl/mannosyltransferase